MDAYGPTLERLRSASGASQRALAREIGLSHTLLSRSEAGLRPPAGPDEVEAIAAALGLEPARRDELLAAAGFWPRAYRVLTPADPTLAAVAELLADISIPESIRVEFRLSIAALARLARAGHSATRPAAGGARGEAP